jgi:hypothetical protein
MITAIAILTPIAVFGALDALAMKFGAESRPGFDERIERTHRPNL